MLENQILLRCQTFRVGRVIDFTRKEEKPRASRWKSFFFFGSTPIASKNQTKLPVREGYYILMYWQSLYKHFSTVRV